MPFVAVQNTIFANPLYVAVTAYIKVRRFGFLPIIGVAINFLFERNAFLYLNCISSKKAYFLFDWSLHPIDNEFIRDSPS